MPPLYTKIELHEMTTVLEALGFEYYNDPYATEYVFQKYITRNDKMYTLRLYTAIAKYNSDSRPVGEDAIRLVVLCNDKHYGNGRVNRTQNWRKNMIARINKWDELFKVCPQCGNVLKQKVGKFGLFYGCSTYPACGYTEKREY